MMTVGREENKGGMSMTHQEVREQLGHNGHECRVRITRDGQIMRYGSPDPTNRSADYWQWLGYLAELLAPGGLLLAWSEMKRIPEGWETIS
jgi:hypothetical protein